MRDLFGNELKLLLLFALAVLLLTSKLGSRALWDPDEGRNAQVVQEMHHSGHWIIPSFNGHPRLEKPPLYYWISSVVAELLGLNERALRFPSLLAALGVLLLVAALAQEMGGASLSLFSTSILLTSIIFLLYARAVIFDMTFTFFTTLPFFCYWKSRKETSPVWPSLLYISLALAVLTKGPLGLFPLFIVFLYSLITGERGWFNSCRWGIPLVLILSIPWFLYVELQVPHGATNFLVRENLQRFLKGAGGHREPVFFYLYLLMITLFPWWLSFFSLFKIKHWSKSDTLLVLWFLLPLMFFSFSHSKAPQYILPAVPACSILLGRIWCDAHPRLPGMALGLGLLLIPVFLLSLPVIPVSVPLFILLGIGIWGAVLLVISSFAGKNSHFISIFLILSLVWCTSQFLLPRLDPLRSGKVLVMHSKSVSWQRGVVFYKSLFPSVLFYADTRGEKVKKMEMVEHALKEGRPVVTSLKRFLRNGWPTSNHLVIVGNMVIMEERGSAGIHSSSPIQ